MRIAEVAYPLPLHRTFDYEVPPEFKERLAAGSRIRAPFGPRRSMQGLVMSVRDGTPSRSLKTISKLLDMEPLLSEEHVALARWLSHRYCAPVGECLKALIPANLRDARRELKQGSSDADWEVEAPAPPKERFTLTSGQAAALERIQAKLKKRKFSRSLMFGVPASGKTEVYIRLIREAVASGGQALFLLPEISLTRPFFEEFRASVGLPIALWHSQIGARRRKSVWLGLRSGAVRVVVGARSASLLPFKDLRLAVMDEEQDESFKQDEQPPNYHARDVVLERARRFGACVVLGSATPSVEVFAGARQGDWDLLRLDERVSKETDRPPVHLIAHPPGPNVCLSDELLERTKECLQKGEQAIFLVNRRGYSNFVICRKCGWVARCPVCSVAFIHHKREGGVERGAPPHSRPSGNASGAWRQESLFGESRYHLRCHHCDRTTEVPAACGRCKAAPLRFSGVGTQKVVAELRQRLPFAKILRMDRDSVAKEKVEESGIYDDFKAGKADVLVGTKLVAKGFHFPRVTLVGIVDADTMLNMPDFRAAERTVQMLIQAAGRAGRADRPGQVLLQTAQPTHYAIQAVARGDYAQFADQELGFRKELSYPPRSMLVRLVFSSANEAAVSKGAAAAAKKLQGALHEEDEVLGPSPGVLAKLRGLFRFHLLIKIKEESRFASALDAVRDLVPPSTVKMKVNVDPYDFF